jgi:beta-galactosidase GanA
MPELRLLPSCFTAILLLCVFAGGPPRVHATQDSDTILVGVVYNLFHEEYADDESFFAQADADLAAIREAGFTHVLLFPVSEWDVSTRRLRWTRTDHLVRKIEELGLKFVPLMLKEEQCSHYFPIWKFDETGLWDEHHRRNGGRNNRENVDFADPRVFPVLEDYFRAVIARYGSSPALDFYNIWNEPHYSSTADHVVQRFHAWLNNKYTDLAGLRRAWGDDYDSWSQVTPFLNDDWNSSMPAMDWAEFRLDLNGILLGELVAMLRKYDPARPVNANPVGTSFAGFTEFGGYSTDDWVYTAHNTFNGVSYYPDGWDRMHAPRPHPSWLHNFNFNVFRSAAGEKDYILTELYTNAKNGLTLGGYLDPITARNLAWIALSNDCKGIIYWKWRPFMRGRQSLGRGLVLADGSLAPRGEAVADFAATMRRHGRLLHEARLEVAILVDRTGFLKVLDQPIDPRTRSFMHDSHAGIFRALDEANVVADVVRTDRDFTAQSLLGYRIVFLPFQIVMRREVAAILRDFVLAGGTVVADARTATIDELDFAYPRSPGAGLIDLFGTERIDWIAEERTHRVVMTSMLGECSGELSARFFRETLRPHPGTTVWATFAETGSPALVSRSHGAGEAWLAAFAIGASHHAEPARGIANLVTALCRRAGVTPPASFDVQGGSMPSVRLHRRGDERIVYLFNHSDEPFVGTMSVDDLSTFEAVDLLGDSRGTSLRVTRGSRGLPVRLGPRDTSVLHLVPID